MAAVATAASSLGRTAATAGSSDVAALPVSERLVGELGHPAELPERGLGVQAGHRPAGPADDLRAGRLDDRRDPLEPAGDRRQPVGERGELAGEEREDAAAEEVDPLERIPGLLAELRLAEPDPVELHEQQVAIDPLVGRQVGVGEPAQHGLPAPDEGEPRASPGLAQVGPLGIVGVHPDRRRVERVESEELVEERVGPGREGRRRAGHRTECIGRGRCPPPGCGTFGAPLREPNRFPRLGT